MEVPREVRFSCGLARCDPAEGIVRLEFDVGTNVGLAEAREEIAAVKAVSGGRRLPVLLDLTNVRSTDLRARMYFGGQETRSAYKVIAFVTPSPASRALLNVFLTFHGWATKERIRAFKSEVEAREWLLDFVE